MAGGLRRMVRYGPSLGLDEHCGDAPYLDQHPSAQRLPGVELWLDLWCIWILPLLRRGPKWCVLQHQALSMTG